MFRIYRRRHRPNRLVLVVFLSVYFTYGIQLYVKDNITIIDVQGMTLKHNRGKCQNSSGCVNGKLNLDQKGTELQVENQSRSKDIIDEYLNKFPEITLNPMTEKSLNPRSVSNLTEILHNSLRKPYLIEKPDLCSSVDNLKVMIIVHSSLNNFEKRIAMRETWTNNSYYSDLGNVQTLFVLGRTQNKTLNNRIKLEFETYGDILQGDFTDTYHNITIKGVTAYKWLTERCRNAEIILKVDDDVIIDMFYFLTIHAPIILSKKDHISCRLLTTSSIKRNRKDKWHVSRNQFYKERYYPPYCQGFMASFNNDVIPKLFKSALMTPFFWVDDVYLYGLVPRNIETISYTKLRYGKTVMWGVEEVYRCLKRQENCQYFVVMIWSDIPVRMRQL